MINYKITAIAWRSNNFKSFIEELENSGIDENVVEQIKRWCW